MTTTTVVRTFERSTFDDPNDERREGSR